MSDPNLSVKDIFDKAQEMQNQFKKMQDSFEKKRITGTAGIHDKEAIFVDATVNGARNLVGLDVGEGSWKEEKSVLLDLIISAVNDATDKLNAEMQDEMKKIYDATGSMDGG